MTQEPKYEDASRMCKHIERGELSKFAVLVLATSYESDGNAPRFNHQLVLCPYCAGLVRATVAQTLRIGIDWDLGG